MRVTMERHETLVEAFRLAILSVTSSCTSFSMAAEGVKSGRVPIIYPHVLVRRHAAQASACNPFQTTLVS